MDVGGLGAGITCFFPPVAIHTTVPNSFPIPAENTTTWTGEPTPVSARELIQDVQPFAAASDRSYATDTTGENWAVFVSKHAQDFGLSPEDLPAFIQEVNASGFDAKIFFNIDGHPLLAFRGSDLEKAFVEDVTTDVANYQSVFSAATNQYEFALKLARVALFNYPTLYLTGHSKGGGMAAYAGSTIGIPTLTFNPTNVPLYAKTPADSYVLNIDLEGGQPSRSRPNVGRTITFDDDILAFQFQYPAPSDLLVAGARDVYPGFTERHDIKNFIDLGYDRLDFSFDQTSSSMDFVVKATEGAELVPVCETGG